jgi:ribosomal protein RSM22 (predicted rRNA methylase)
MNLSFLRQHLLYEFKNEVDLLKAIDELSLKFTQNRDQIGDYLKDKRLVSAYTAFYLTTNVPKFEGVIPWLPSNWLDDLRQSSLIDIGSGPGTFSFAIREWVGAPLNIVQLETSQIMREQALKLWQGLYPQEKLLQSKNELKVLRSPKFALFGHSANEMGAEEVLNYVRDIDPDHILFIEPGTKDFFPKMLKIREALLHLGYNILFPCPTNEKCPLANSVNDWCHQFIHIKQNTDIERLSQMARKDRRLLPLTVQAFSKNRYSLTEKTRVVRVFAETKFSFEWDVCELNQNKHFQIMKRGLSKDTLEVLAQTKAGDSLEVEVEKILEQAVRVKIKSINNGLL